MARVELTFNKDVTKRADVHAAIDLVISSVHRVTEFCNTCGLGGLDVHMNGLGSEDFGVENATIPGVVDIKLQ